MKKIVFILGSNRKNSFNGQLAKAAASYLQGKAEVSYLDISHLPFINQDHEYPAPKMIAEARNAVMDADGIWFFSPEYNGSYTGMLKNAVDWFSRPLKENDWASGSALKGKKAAISGVSGKSAASGSIANLKGLLSRVMVQVVSPSEGFALAQESFMTDKLILSEADKKRLEEEADSFLASL